MNNDIKIITTHDNKQVELVFNEKFLCPSRDVGIVDLSLGEKVFNWKFRMIFDKNEGDTPFSTKWEYGVDDFQLRVTFFNWVSSNWIELKTAKSVKTQNLEHEFYFKIRVDARSEFERSIHISIWKAV